MKHETRIPRIHTNFPKSYEFVIIGVIRVYDAGAVPND
jgi:hypothetical protein